MSPPLRIATYNVNGLRGRLPRVLDWLNREQPDVACLQELKGEDGVFPIDEIRRAGYGAIWHGQRSWNGVAILARGADPIESRRGLPGGGAEDTHSRYLEAAVSGVIVGCLYLPNGNPQPGPKFDYKLAWFERLIRYAKRLLASGAPVVLAGDYNVVPTDFDIYNPKSWRKDALLQPESRECYERLLAQGWTDALRAKHPDEAIYTFWDYFRNHWQRNAGLRIDHLLLSPSIAPRLLDAGVDTWVRGQPGASDHAPTWITLDAAGGAAKKPVRKPPAKKTPATSAAARKASASKAAATKMPAKKASARKAAATKTPAKKAPAGKSVAKQAPARAAAGKRAAPRKRGDAA